MPEGLNEIESDALAESLNIGMGRAAKSLSEMVGKEVTLSFPLIEILSHASIIESFQQSGPLAAIHQEFTGPFTGQALLIFPEDEGSNLVRLLLQDCGDLKKLSEARQDVLTEVGNIVLNGCLSTMSDLLQEEVVTTIPTYKHQSASELIEECQSKPVLFLQMDFSMVNEKVSGTVAFVLELDSMARFREYVASLLA